jgi:hypothetical protein
VTLSHVGRLAALTLAAFALSACATVSVRSFQERGANVAQYRTFDWIPAVLHETGDPRLDNNRFFHERIQSDIEKQLTSRGFEKDAEGTPGLLVHYHASVAQKINPNGADQPYVRCGDCEPYVFEAGTVVVDLVDFRTGRLVWRGWADDILDGAIDNQDWMEKRLDEAIQRIFNQLPPRL